MSVKKYTYWTFLDLFTSNRANTKLDLKEKGQISLLSWFH